MGQIVRQVMIREAAREIEEKLRELHHEREALRAICPHPGPSKISRPDFIFWESPHWFRCECEDCGQTWTEWQ